MSSSRRLLAPAAALAAALILAGCSGAPAEQSVEEACGILTSADTVDLGIEGFAPQDAAEAEAGLATISDGLNGLNDQISNVEVKTSFETFITEFEAFGALLVEYMTDPTSVEQSEYAAANESTGNAAVALETLCPGYGA